VTFVQAGSTWKVDKGMEKADDFVTALADQVLAAVSN
jgi:hypothetical protein